MPSAKRNALLNAAYQVLRLVFPIITYPYVSRIIGPTGIGKVAYAQRIAEYFALSALLGIPMYGLREVSRSRNSPDQLSRVYSELLILSVITSAIAGAIYIAFPIVFPDLASGRALHWLFLLLILFAPGRLDWFYQGMEKYTFITSRSLAIRVLTAALTFVVVREPSDYPYYGMLWVAGSVVGGVLNTSYSLRLTRFTVRELNIMRHVRNVLPTVGIQLIGTFASVIDVAMLGSLLSDDRYSVGLYTVASRVMRIALSIVTAGISVLMPRVSSLHASGDQRRTDALITKSFAFSVFFALPMTIGLAVTAPDVIRVFAGRDFAPASVTLQILSFQLLVFSLGNVVNMQVFYAQGREKSVLILSIVTTVLSVVVNLLFIPRYRHDGAAIATLIVTTTGLIAQSSLAWKKIHALLFTRDNGRIIALVVIWSVMLIGLRMALADWQTVTRLVAVTGFGMAAYAVGALLLRIPVAAELVKWVWPNRNNTRGE